MTLGIPKSLNNAIIKIKPREAMTLSLPETRSISLSLLGLRKIREFTKEIDILVVGPGLTRDKNTQGLARKVISYQDKPTVIDADGLNALAGHTNILRNNETTPRPRSEQAKQRITILTPHPGEMARLLGVSVKEVQSQRKTIAKKFAQDFKVVVVLKGHHTLVADPGGKIYVNKSGNPGMATAGSGDVLAGMIGAFLGQGLSAFDAGKYAVYLHGLAGDLAVKEKTEISLMASDIIDKIPEAIKRSN